MPMHKDDLGVSGLKFTHTEIRVHRGGLRVNVGLYGQKQQR